MGQEVSHILREVGQRCILPRIKHRRIGHSKMSVTKYIGEFEKPLYFAVFRCISLYFVVNAVFRARARPRIAIISQPIAKNHLTTWFVDESCHGW